MLSSSITTCGNVSTSSHWSCTPIRYGSSNLGGTLPQTESVVAWESPKHSTSLVSHMCVIAREKDGSSCFGKRSRNGCERNSWRSNLNSGDVCTTPFHPWADGYVAYYRDTSSTTAYLATNGNSLLSSTTSIVSGLNRFGDGVNDTGSLESG